MAGRRNWLLIVGLVAGGLFLVSAESAQAQSHAQAQGGVRLRKDVLEKVTFYKAPRQIQILDDGPIVRDHRTGAQDPGTVNIQLGPVGGGAAANGLPSTLPPGGLRLGGGTQGFRLENSNLPKAALGSNINESRLKPGGLPSGKSTNLLAGKPVKQPIATAARPGKLLNGSRPLVAAQQYQPLLTYPSIASTAAGSGKSTFSTSATVTGVVKRRSLLKKVGRQSESVHIQLIPSFLALGTVMPSEVEASQQVSVPRSLRSLRSVGMTV